VEFGVFFQPGFDLNYANLEGTPVTLLQRASPRGQTMTGTVDFTNKPGLYYLRWTTSVNADLHVKFSDPK